MLDIYYQYRRVIVRVARPSAMRSTALRPVCMSFVTSTIQRRPSCCASRASAGMLHVEAVPSPNLIEHMSSISFYEPE